MPSAAYSHGRKTVLVKLGMLPRALGGAAISAGAGYLLAPDERQGQGAILGAALGGLGSALGQKIGPATPNASAALGSLAGLGLSQAYINKKVPDTAEDPYHYYPR